MSGPYSDVCTNDLKKLWENGIVPYVFDDNVSFKLKKSVWKAMRRISSAGPIKFVKRKNQKDYIKIVEKGGYWSYVGKQGGEQELSVAKGWPHPTGSAMHELMHAIGFYHEHCRPDRDQYVIVDKEKIDNINYEKLRKSDVRWFGLYDKESIMHYHLCSEMYLKPGEVDPGIGQRIKLSKGDKRALNRLYSFRNARADTDPSVSNPPIVTETEEAEFDSSKTKKKKNANNFVTIIICVLFVLISV
ncbi:hypothetical protein RhiirC2_850413 [Rhizophagus irregularis]|uniref:Metalloendopeptidase n=1 Tax=Rhizophagus irregularis TaxID=588596 RepID=A0A2N1N7J2_9GLOM|nr:hypothetical protein RhiirC2_850413 [Rhizophagus irregularis]